MEPDKFEKHIKNKLEERRITPSDLAWEKISGQLENPTEQHKNGYFWIGIAASFVLLLGISIFFFNEKDEVIRTPTSNVVDVKEPKVFEESLESEASSFSEKVETEGVVLNENPKTKVDQEVTSKNSEDLIVDVLQDSGTIIANTPPTVLQDEALPMVPTEILDAKIAEVIAKVDAIESKGKVTDAEVDSLLLRAQREILKEKIFITGNSVNALALLSEVEEELDQSFRDQIFETLKTGFLKVRTAVADRNN